MASYKEKLVDLILVKDISILINGMGAGASLLLSVLYYSTVRDSTKTGRILAALFFILGCTILNTVINLSGYGAHTKGFEILTNALVFSIAPLLYLLVKVQQHQEATISLWHFSGTIIYFLASMATLVGANIWEINPTIPVQIHHIFRITWNVHFFIYLIILFFQIYKSKYLLPKLHRLLILGITSIWLTNLGLSVFSEWISPLPEVFRLNCTLLFTLIALWVSYQNLTVAGSNKQVQRGGTSRIKPPTLDNAAEGLEQLVKEKKFYRDPDLNIKTLSVHLGIPYYQLSSTINRYYHQNFNQFINSIRVKEVISQLRNNQLETYSVIGLAQNAGFRSSSAFYAAFKKETGTTPTDFIAEGYSQDSRYPDLQIRTHEG